MRLDAPVISRWGLLSIGVLAANAAVLFIALARDLSLIEILLVYCCESVWIAVFGALRLIVASILGDPYQNRWVELSRGSSLLASIVIIFMVCSTFIWIPGVAFGSVLYAEHVISANGSNIDDLRHIRLVLGASLVFLGSHTLSFLAGFLAMGEFRLARVGDLLLFPLKRSLALLGSIVAGVAAIVLLPDIAGTMVFVLIVVVLKLVLDFRLYRGPVQVPALSGYVD